MTWAEKNNIAVGAKEISLLFGAVVDPVAAQLKAQGFKIDDAPVDRWQRACDAAVTLHLYGHLSDSAVRGVRQRIIRGISKHYSRKK